MEETLAVGARHPVGCGCPMCQAAAAALTAATPAAHFENAATFTAHAATSVPVADAARSPVPTSGSGETWDGVGTWPLLGRNKRADDSFADRPADGTALARFLATLADATDAPDFGLGIRRPNFADATDASDFWQGIRLPMS
jgi:hypothetical protein